MIDYHREDIIPTHDIHGNPILNSRGEPFPDIDLTEEQMIYAIQDTMRGTNMKSNENKPLCPEFIEVAVKQTGMKAWNKKVKRFKRDGSNTKAWDDYLTLLGCKLAELIV